GRRQCAALLEGKTSAPLRPVGRARSRRAGDARELARSTGVLPLRRAAPADRSGMGICGPKGIGTGRKPMGVDRDRLPPLSGVRARSIQGILRALVRHPQGAARGQLRDARTHRARALSQFLYARSGRHLRGFSHLRGMTAVIRSRDNPRIRRWAKLATDSRFRRSEGRVLIEGPHLVAEALQAGLESITLIVSETGLKKKEVRTLVGRREPVVLGDHIFGIVADAETPPGIAAEIEVPKISQRPSGPALFLEGVQDPANVGAILRSA